MHLIIITNGHAVKDHSICLSEIDVAAFINNSEAVKTLDNESETWVHHWFEWDIETLLATGELDYSGDNGSWSIKSVDIKKQLKLTPSFRMEDLID